MTFRRVFLLIPLAGVLLLCVAEQYSGCKSNESPLAPAPCSNRNRTAYGGGVLSFALDNGTETRIAAGNYIPSDQFINDTSARQGAGGFVRDTLVALKPLKGMVVGFTHSLSAGTLYDTLLVFKVYNDSGPLSTGDYLFARTTAHPHGKYCSVTLLASDALHQYTVFSARDGRFTISLYDSCEQHLRGTFSGTLWDVADTTYQLQVTSGAVDITYVDHFFNY